MRFLYILLLLLFMTSCYEKPRDCKAYHTGSYYSEVTISGALYKSNFTRTKTLQVETYDSKTDSSSVRWINDCEMIFRTLSPKNRAERKDIHLKILTTTDSSYTFEYNYVGEPKKEQGVAYKN